MFNTYNFGLYSTSFFEFVIVIFFTIIVLGFGFVYQTQKQGYKPEYKFFTIAIFTKLLGAFLYAYYYAFVFHGGDTTVYFETAMIFRHVFFTAPDGFFEIFFTPSTKEHYEIFFSVEMWPFEETYLDHKQNFVSKVITLPIILSGGSFLISTVIMGFFSFFPLWSLYKALLKVCPNYNYNFIACFLLPSSMFWASGLSKDTVTLMGICLMISNAIRFEEFNGTKRIYSILLMISGFLLVLFAKPYVVMPFLPAFMTWKLSARIKRTFADAWVKTIVVPIVVVFGIVVSYFILAQLGDTLDKFALDKALETAAETQQDLKKEYYQGQSFDIGDFEPTIPGVIQKVPIATFAGLFYPLPGQVFGGMANVAVLETSVLLYLILYIILNRNLLRKTYKIDEEKKNILGFFLIFGLLFAFIIGLSTSNFGALVRFRVPILPLIFCYVFVHYYYVKNESHVR